MLLTSYTNAVLITVTQRLKHAYWTVNVSCHASVVVQAALASGPSIAGSAFLQRNKEQVETTLDKMLTAFTEKACAKLTVCEYRQAQKTRLESSLQQFAFNNEVQSFAAPASGLTPVPQSAAEVATLVANNNSKLMSCQQLATAFEETQKARDALHVCLEREQRLLNELEESVQHSLQLSLQVVNTAATRLRLDDPQREQRHTEMLLRYTVTGALFRLLLCLACIECLCSSPADSAHTSFLPQVRESVSRAFRSSFALIPNLVCQCLTLCSGTSESSMMKSSCCNSRRSVHEQQSEAYLSSKTSRKHCL